ncbi:hypothetical protein QQS21_009442 [Conoideocrella luteorostrata]|uniref:Uncharacterized protein n=1 Tax=Conoideocrella luteorostrata TaxID=1105319 RepID=A0AAJ0CH30_9HYPO|nr:hypothetical protein QQS21_009442 [Conoideocrella luteorostrata]
MSQQFSTLEVVPDSQKQVAFDPTPPEAIAQEKHQFTELGTDSRRAQNAAPQRKRTCGLSPRVFWLVICVGLLLIAGLVAGVVGGVVGSKQHSKSEDTSSSSSSSSSLSRSSSSTANPTSTSASSVSITTVTEAAPTQTLYRDCPSSNYTVYLALGDSRNQFRKICSASFHHWSSAELVNKKTSSLNDCIDLCATYNKNNATEIAAGRGSICNSVCWRHKLDDPDWPGQCFGGVTQNSSTAGFSIQDELICDSAAWINQVIPRRR